MRRDLRVIDLCHGGDLLGLPDTTDTAQGRLQDRGCPGPQHRRELGLGGQPLSGRDRDRHGPRYGGHLFDRIWRDRLFVPERAVGRDGVPQTDRACSGELPVGAEQQIGLVANRRADRFAKGDRLRDVGHRRHMPAAQCIGPRRIELDRGIATRHTVQRRFRRHLGRGPESGHIVMRQRVKIGIAPHAFIHPAADQGIYRTIPILAQNIPAGDLQPRKCAHDGQVGSLGKA